MTTAADELIERLRAQSDNARATYYRVRTERNGDFGPQMLRALNEWAEASAREDGAREMMRAIIAGEKP